MNRGSFLAIVLGVVAAAGLFGALAARSGAESGDAPETEAAVADADTRGGVPDDVPSTTEPPPAPTETSEAQISPPILSPAGTLENIDVWLQTDATALEDFAGQVRIVQFWTYSCHNCKATIPFLQDIYATHHDSGLEIIGVHAPEFSFEEDIDGVQKAAIELGVTWPIAIDNSKTNFRSWQPDRRFWPRTYVVDQNGDIRFDRIGEGRYDELEETVAWLLENGP